MPIEVSDLRPTIVPKSDQLNSEQLLAGPITIIVSDVRVGSEDQPVVIHYHGEGGRPFKPCKTMRKALIFAWGPDGREWVGRAMALYNDPAVKFGGEEVGGIRISHLSDVERDVQLSLTKTKGKKALHVIKAMPRPGGAMLEARNVDELKAAFGAAYKSTSDAILRAGLKAVYDDRTAELNNAPAPADA